MSADTSIIYPTVLYRIDRIDVQAARTAAAVVDTELGKALLVFRSRADAEGFRRDTGRLPVSEGFGAVNVGDEEIADLLEMHSLRAVAMPEAWTGHGRVDLFSAENFLRLLEESPAV